MARHSNEDCPSASRSAAKTNTIPQTLRTCALASCAALTATSLSASIQGRTCQYSCCGKEVAAADKMRLATATSGRCSEVISWGIHGSQIHPGKSAAFCATVLPSISAPFGSTITRCRRRGTRLRASVLASRMACETVAERRHASTGVERDPGRRNLENDTPMPIHAATGASATASFSLASSMSQGIQATAPLSTFRTCRHKICPRPSKLPSRVARV